MVVFNFIIKWLLWIKNIPNPKWAANKTFERPKSWIHTWMQTMWSQCQFHTSPKTKCLIWIQCFWYETKYRLLNWIDVYCRQFTSDFKIIEWNKNWCAWKLKATASQYWDLVEYNKSHTIDAKMSDQCTILSGSIEFIRRTICLRKLSSTK